MGTSLPGVDGENSTTQQ